jgi:sulfatase maturation enzyme AslB (radical SAM superfamily)
MDNNVVTNYLYLNITERCTLKCKICINETPKYKNPKDIPLETLLKSIDKIFEVYDYIQTFDLGGGEPLLYKDIHLIVEYALKYKDHFGVLRIVTNGTILPQEELLKLMSRNAKLMFVFDDYGTLSSKKKEFSTLIRNNHIEAKINIYHGEDQLCGGWIDLGDFSNRNYSEEKYNELFERCFSAHWICLTSKNGKIYLCSRALQGEELGFFKNKEGEYLDLFDDSIPIEKKKEIALNFGENPIEACKYCNSFDSERSPRVSAAEQI